MSNDIEEVSQSSCDLCPLIDRLEAVEKKVDEVSHSSKLIENMFTQVDKVVNLVTALSGRILSVEKATVKAQEAFSKHMENEEEDRKEILKFMSKLEGKVLTNEVGDKITKFKVGLLWSVVIFLLTGIATGVGALMYKAIELKLFG